MADYTVGDVLPFATTVLDASGALANAGAMTLSVTLDGVAVSGSPFTVTSTSTGKYDQDVPAPTGGLYLGYWQATGTNAGAHKQRFRVGSDVDHLFVSLEDMKNHLRIPLTTTTHDQKLEAFLGSATKTIEGMTGPVVPRTISERHYGDQYYVMLRRPPVLSVTSVVGIDVVNTLTAANLDVDEFGRAGYKIRAILPFGRYQWTYQAGRVGEIPEDLAEAVKELVRDRWDSQRGASSLPVTGSAAAAYEPYRAATKLSPLVESMISDYVLPRVA
jgi:hypothetical protein